MSGYQGIGKPRVPQMSGAGDGDVIFYVEEADAGRCGGLGLPAG
jgi:hypothetical protein